MTICSKCGEDISSYKNLMHRVLCDQCAIESSNVRSCPKHKNLRVAWEPSAEFPTCPVCKWELDHHADDGKPASGGESQPTERS